MNELGSAAGRTLLNCAIFEEKRFGSATWIGSVRKERWKGVAWRVDLHRALLV